MSAVVRILSTKTLDSSPAILMISPDGNKTIINCGEGCQRIFLELSQKISSVTRVCLTHLSYETLGGLPGMILTTADISAAIIKDVAKVASNKAAVSSGATAASVLPTSGGGGGNGNTTTKRDRKNNKPKTKSKKSGDDELEGNPSSSLPGLDIIGPKNTQHFMSSLKHFMRRDAYQVHIHEGKYIDTGNWNNNKNNSNCTKSKKRKRNNINNNNNTSDGGDDKSQEYFSIETIVCDTNNKSNQDDCNDMKLDDPNDDKIPNNKSNSNNKQYLSYIFTTPPIQGKFMAEKAKELGIPPGPLYGKLKSGQSITFTNKDGQEKTVESQQVVEPGTPGVSTAILYYPSEDILEQLMESDQLCQLRRQNGSNNNGNDTILEIIIHIAPSNLFSTRKCNEWRKAFGGNVQHMFVNSSGGDYNDEEEGLTGMTPFLSARAGAFARSQLSNDIFGLLSPMIDPQNNDDDNVQEAMKVENDDSHINYITARPLLEYVIVPRSKKGFQNQSSFRDAWIKLKADAEELVRRSGADVHARDIVKELETSTKPNNPGGDDKRRGGELIFTGTGSAIPCKHRNVSGIFLRMENGNSMLLDVGEGTVGQLLGMRHVESCRDVVTEMKAVWISHPHADHHLGIIRLLEERAKYTDEKITLIAPTNLYYFLREYENIDPSIINSYNFINCRDLVNLSGGTKRPDDFLGNWNKMKIDLGIKSCRAVPVQHCPNAFAVILDGTPFGSLAYSGDCRPSSRLAAAAMNVDVLIHEATFANGMEAEANVKRHCTVGEALNVGVQMKAKNVILTHFSQRYPKIPPLSSSTADGNGTDSSISFPVIFAFDFARLSPNNLVTASKLTPSLRLLYPEDEKNSIGCNEEEDSVINDALQIPGLFAQNSLL